MEYRNIAGLALSAFLFTGVFNAAAAERGDLLEGLAERAEERLGHYDKAVAFCDHVNQEIKPLLQAAGVDKKLSATFEPEYVSCEVIVDHRHTNYSGRSIDDRTHDQFADHLIAMMTLEEQRALLEHIEPNSPAMRSLDTKIRERVENFDKAKDLCDEVTDKVVPALAEAGVSQTITANFNAERSTCEIRVGDNLKRYDGRFIGYRTSDEFADQLIANTSYEEWQVIRDNLPGLMN